MDCNDCMNAMNHKPINPWTVGLDMITVHIYMLGTSVLFWNNNKPSTTAVAISVVDCFSND